MAEPIFNESTNSWRLRTFVGTDQFGKKIYKSFSGKTARECKKKEKEWLKAGGKVEATTRLTLGEAIDKFIKTCEAQKYSPATVSNYKSIRRNSYPKIINTPISKLTAMMIQEQLDDRALVCSPKTLRNDLYLVTTVLKRFRPELSLASIILAKNPKKAKRAFSSDWAPEIIQEAKKMDQELAVYCAIMINTGMRPSEIYALTWGDISKRPITSVNGTQFGTISVTKAEVRDSNGEYQLKGTKTESGNRVIQCAWSLIRFIDDQLMWGDPDEKVLYMTPHYASKRFKVLAGKIDLPADFRFYDLRHFFATAMVHAGATEEELSSAMGHSTSAFSHSVYVEMLAESQQAVNDKMASATAAMLG